MPLVRIDVNEGRSEQEFRAIGDAIQEALVSTCGVPADDRFQVFTVHSSQTLTYDESYMGMHRSDGFVVVQVTFNAGRTTEQKVALYHRTAELLAEKAGVSPDDVFINLVEVQRENWSFGRGVAQLVPQPERR